MPIGTYSPRTTQTVGSTASLGNPDQAALFVSALTAHSPPSSSVNRDPFCWSSQTSRNPKQGEGGAQTSSRMPRAGAASLIPRDSEEGPRQGWRKAGKVGGSKERGGQKTCLGKAGQTGSC